MNQGVAGILCLAAIASLSERVVAQEEGPSSEQALKLLKEGNARFVADQLREAVPPSHQRLATAKKQRPIAIVLACADSRAAPEYIFDKGIGVLFVIRVAGNVGGPDVYASMEYAAAVLGAPLIVVMGHTNCGAVDAVVKEKELPTNNLKGLVRLVRTGKNPEDLNAAIRHNVIAQAELVGKRSPLLKEFVETKRVRIVPALYDLKNGQVTWIENE